MSDNSEEEEGRIHVMQYQAQRDLVDEIVTVAKQDAIEEKVHEEDVQGIKQIWGKMIVDHI